MPVNKQIPGIQIKKIKEVLFQIEESLYRNDGAPILVEFSGRTAFNLQQNILSFTVTAFYHYEDTPKQQLARIEVDNHFIVENLKDYIEGTQVLLPAPTMITIVSLSISHTRALFYKHLSGTVYQENVIQILDPVKVTQAFFPKIFEEEKDVTVVSVSE